ncbi:hypothetical protein MMC06_000916 [Schaereria dolodes]|nr:hypothetical protein [Schaereria dolodes]
MPSVAALTREVEGRGTDGTDISDMALYNLSRAESAICSLSNKSSWSNADTSSFDCMHYDGDNALRHCAKQLSIRPGQHILDVGSGFSATGRFLASTYHVRVTGIELQLKVHSLAEHIIQRNPDSRISQAVRSVNADFLTLAPEALSDDEGMILCDHIVSFLCLPHIPSRPAFFSQASRFLKSGGKIYLEDFYNIISLPHNEPQLTEDERHKLRKIVKCYNIPTASSYVAEMRAAGFKDIQFEDVSAQWTSLLQDRAKKYKAVEHRNSDLEVLYDTMVELFEGGNLGGVRVTATRT